MQSSFRPYFTHVMHMWHCFDFNNDDIYIKIMDININFNIDLNASLNIYMKVKVLNLYHNASVLPLWMPYLLHIAECCENTAKQVYKYNSAKYHEAVGLKLLICKNYILLRTKIASSLILMSHELYMCMFTVLLLGYCSSNAAAGNL